MGVWCVRVCGCMCQGILHNGRPSHPSKVFHVPEEERRRDLHKPFGGESTQAQIVRDVMSKTSCHIEICEAKDHSLSIMVTGKAEGVIMARKEILKKLQTQVCVCPVCVCVCVGGCPVWGCCVCVCVLWGVLCGGVWGGGVRNVVNDSVPNVIELVFEILCEAACVCVRVCVVCVWCVCCVCVCGVCGVCVCTRVCCVCV